MPVSTFLAIPLIIITLIGVAIGRYPWLRMNRATIALVGATTLIAIGAIVLDEAYTALDEYANPARGRALAGKYVVETYDVLMCLLKKKGVWGVVRSYFLIFLGVAASGLVAGRM